ncbi:hypothetical protein LEMLEM_LOCUS6837 [Lemmus lemmus]
MPCLLSILFQSLFWSHSCTQQRKVVFSDQSQVLPEVPTAGGDMKRSLEQRFHGEVALDQFLLSVPGALTCGWDAAVLGLRKPCGQGPPILGSKRRTKLEPRVLPALGFSESPGTSPLEAEWKGQSTNSSIMPSNMENHTSPYIQQETAANNSRNEMTGTEDIALEMSRRVPRKQTPCSWSSWDQLLWKFKENHGNSSIKLCWPARKPQKSTCLQRAGITSESPHSFYVGSGDCVSHHTVFMWDPHARTRT